MALVAFQTVYKALDDAMKADSAVEALPELKEALKAAMSVLLLEVASNTAVAAAVDSQVMTYRPPAGKYDKAAGPQAPLLDAAILKSSLLTALKTCAHYPAILAMPHLMETTRKLLCAAPAKGVATYLVDELGRDIDTCMNAKTLIAVQEVLRTHMQAEGRFKKDLMGFILGPDNVKSVRTAANKAAKKQAEVEAVDATALESETKKLAAAEAKKRAAEFAALQKKG